VLALLLLGSCSERLTMCHCILLDYAYEKRAKDGSSAGPETDSASACDCRANRKRAEDYPAE